MSAANRKPYLGESIHFAVRERECRAAIVSGLQDVTGIALTWFPVGAGPIPGRNIAHDELRTKDTWHYAH